MPNDQKVDAAQEKVRRWGETLAAGQWDWNLLGHALEYCRDAIREDARHQRAWTLLADVYHLVSRDDLANAALDRSYQLAAPGQNHPGGFFKRVRNRIDTGEPFGNMLSRQQAPNWFVEKYADFLSSSDPLAGQPRRPRVFVVHGRDMDTLEKVELTLHRIGAEPRVLARLVFPGSTVIEALESELPQADAVVCLLTPDDEGRRRGEAHLRSRARQNVLIESGYAVINKRRRSIIVSLGAVEIPSDLQGILQVQQAAWDAVAAMGLARHLAAMGLPVDALHAAPPSHLATSPFPPPL